MRLSTGSYYCDRCYESFVKGFRVARYVTSQRLMALRPRAYDLGVAAANSSSIPDNLFGPRIDPDPDEDECKETIPSTSEAVRPLYRVTWYQADGLYKVTSISNPGVGCLRQLGATFRPDSVVSRTILNSADHDVEVFYEEGSCRG